MNATSNPQTAAEQGRKNYRDVTTADAAVPESVRAMAERAVDQSREVYDRSKDALDASRPLRRPSTLPGKALWRSTAKSSISPSGM